MSAPANAIVRVIEPRGPASLAAALRALKRTLSHSGTLTLFRDRSRLFAYLRPGQRRKLKSVKARRQELKRRPRELSPYDPEAKLPLRDGERTRRIAPPK